MHLNLPPFAATTVGSLPRPPYLPGGRARPQAALQRAVGEAIALQEDLGLDVLVDGELDRGEMASYFAGRLMGFQRGGPVRSFGSYYYRKPIVRGPVRWTGPVTVSTWRYAQSLTSRPVKTSVIGPYTLAEWSFDEYYGDRRRLVLDAAQALRSELLALQKAGATHVQVDEPAFATRLEDNDLFLEGISTLCQGVSLHVTLHACYGDFANFADILPRLPVAEVQLEMANSGLDAASIFSELPGRMRAGIGVVDVQDAAVEPMDIILERIERASQVVDARRLTVTPDCGLRWLDSSVAIAKLRNLAEAVRVARQRYAPGRTLSG